LAVGNRTEITKGLEEGERIVISGNFLIDSESSLEMAVRGNRIAGAEARDPVSGARCLSEQGGESRKKDQLHGKNLLLASSDESKAQFVKNRVGT